MSSLPAIRVALETQLATVTPSIATAPENTPFAPTTGTPFQQPFLLAAEPANLEIGPGYVEQGIFQVNLFFPKDKGVQPVIAQAEAIRAAFPFRSSLANGGVTVIIDNTPEIAPARPDGDRFMVPVKIRWQARIGS